MRNKTTSSSRAAGAQLVRRRWQHLRAKCTSGDSEAVGARLTDAPRADNLKYMSRLMFVAVTSITFSVAAAAQQVPGRDLLQFPLGVLAEAPALSAQMPGGFWNPATAAYSSSNRLQLGFAALSTPYEEGVELKLLAGTLRLRPNVTGSLSFAQASVGDILKTETDPQSLGEEIPYSTMIISAGTAARGKAATFGLAARYRWGSLDTAQNGAFSIDGGVVIDRAFGTPVRVAASTFLLSPSRAVEAASYLVAADVPLAPGDSLWHVRGGASLQVTEGRGHESYVFATSRYRGVDANGGVLQTTAFGNVNRRVRFGVGLHYARYGVAIAREDGAAGLGASYQFLLTSVFR